MDLLSNNMCVLTHLNEIRALVIQVDHPGSMCPKLNQYTRGLLFKFDLSKYPPFPPNVAHYQQSKISISILHKESETMGLLTTIKWLTLRSPLIQERLSEQNIQSRTLEHTRTCSYCFNPFMVEITAYL